MLDYSAGLPRSNAAKASPRLDRSICGHRSEKLYWTDARVLAPVVMLVAIARISIDPFSIERHHANFAHSFIVAQSFIITGPDIWQGCSKNLHQSEVLVLVHLLDKFSCLPIFSHNAITSSDQSVEDVRQEVKGSPVSNALAKLLPLVFWISNRIVIFLELHAIRVAGETARNLRTSFQGECNCPFHHSPLRPRGLEARQPWCDLQCTR